MALLSTGAARLSTIVYSRAAPLPLLSLLFFANDAIICSSKNRLGEPVFCVISGALLPKILLNPRQRPLLAKQRQRVIQLGAKGCPGGGDADEAKEHAGLVASGLEKLIEGVLDGAWRPRMLLSQGGVGRGKELPALLVRQFAQRLVGGNELLIDSGLFEEVAAQHWQLGQGLEAVLHQSKHLFLVRFVGASGAGWPIVLNPAVEVIE